jgi:hypothetical protein
MSEQDKAEIRKIIKEEIEANFSNRAKRTTQLNTSNKPTDQVKKAIYIETVSPAY